MTEGLRSKIEATAREEIRRYMDPGYREKRMLEQGDFAGLVAFLKQRARLLRRMAWVLTVGYPRTRVALLDQIAQGMPSAGIQVVGTSARAELDLYSARLADPVAVVVGNESNGLRDAVKEACTQLVRIPMYPGQSSLNVATATAVVLYELVRNQHGKTRLAGEPVPFL